MNILEFTPPSPTEVKSIQIKSTPSARVCPLQVGSCQFIPKRPCPICPVVNWPIPKPANPAGKEISAALAEITFGFQLIVKSTTSKSLKLDTSVQMVNDSPGFTH